MNQEQNKLKETAGKKTLTIGFGVKMFLIGLFANGALLLGYFCILMFVKTTYQSDIDTNLCKFYDDLSEECDLEVQNDGEFLTYCLAEFPEAILSRSEAKSYDAVINAFANDPYRWALFDLPGGQEILVAWEKRLFGWHCYTMVPDSAISWPDPKSWLGSGWLYKDGVRVKAYDPMTVSMDPVEIIKLYQYGTWKGIGFLRSHDYGTVAMNDNGKIKYSYSAEFYSEDVHNVTPYTDYEKPWWADENSVWSDHIVESDYVEEGNTATGFCKTDYYLDLPIDYTPGKIYATDWYSKDYMANSDGPGTFFLTDDGALQYMQGELLEEWDLPISSVDTDRCYIMAVRSERGYLAYACDGYQLFGLKAYGKYDVLIERIVNRFSGHYDSLFGLADGNLVYWDDNTYLTLAEDVIDADFTDAKIFEKSEGCYAISGEDVYSSITDENSWQIVFLGTESLAYYLQVYHLVDVGRYVD